MINLNKPEVITSLATSGILVHIEVKSWSATKQDEEISDEVNIAKKADRNAGRFVKNLLADVKEHKDCLRDRAAWYNWIQRETFAWAGAWRYLPNPRIPQFMRDYASRKQHTEKLVDDLIAALPTAISNMAFTLGDAFKREDYPTDEEVRSKYGVTLFTNEVPVGDFRNKLANDLADDLQKHYTQQAQRWAQDIANKQVEQLVDLMQRISKCCEVETVIDPKKGVKVVRRKLYDSTIERALELCDTFKDFNIMNDGKLEAARASLQSVLRCVNIEALKQSDSMRTRVKTEVDDILSKFGMV